MAKVLILDIEKKLWVEFKKRTPKSITMNEAVVNVIKDYLKEEL